MISAFAPDAKGWVVRMPHSKITSWWYGPNHGWGLTSGGLDHCVAVWPTKKAATEAARRIDLRKFLVERVEEAVAFAITECDRRKMSVLASDRPDKKEIAAANDRTKAYLQGKQKTRR